MMDKCEEQHKMEKEKKVTVKIRGYFLLWILFDISTAMVGKAIHHSTFWAIMDFIFAPLAWIKWFICQEVTLSIIKSAFAWFMK